MPDDLERHLTPPRQLDAIHMHGEDASLKCHPAATPDDPHVGHDASLLNSAINCCKSVGSGATNSTRDPSDGCVKAIRAA